MRSIESIAILGMIFGMFGTTLGGIVGTILNIKSKRVISFVLEFAAGLMTAVICFDLIPESLKFISNIGTIIGILIGVILMIFCNNFVNRKFLSSNKEKPNLLKVGIVIGIGLAIHNFPEGLAIGSGFEASSELGIALAMAICVHDFPEGIAMAVPLKQGGYSKIRVIVYTALSGITTGIGALMGAIIGNISNSMIGISLGFAAGAMLYITACEIIPESNTMYQGRISKIGNILGILTGILII